MKWIKPFNESFGGECSFEDFKDIIEDVLDDFDFDYSFQEYIEGNQGNVPNPFYECIINIEPTKYDLDDDVPPLHMRFLNDFLPHTRKPKNVTDEMIDIAVSDANSNITDLITLKNDLDDVIKYQTNCVKLIETMKGITKRLRGFSNCRSCNIGFDGDEMCIIFDIKI